MNKELKRAIFNWLVDNRKEFQIVLACINEFEQYIYNKEGNYIIGGKEVVEFIDKASKLVLED